ncbi:MAG TPA: PilZ domain-containing protein [Thermodesulfovibrionales bacterium]|nr:PilZ domain-containing protein [Thermodesulfovibrionales bacterium]
MIEKRRYTRYMVEGMGIYARTIFDTVVEILDISMTGGSVRGTKRFSIGSEYSFKFEHDGRVVSIRGVVVWEKLTGTNKIAEGEAMPVYTAGIEFKNGLADKKMDELRDIFIGKVKKRRLDSVKVNIVPPEKVLLSYFETCLVRDVSFGGMRIETGQEPTVDTVFSLEIILPESENAIPCKGRIAFYQQVPEKMPPRYSAGVEFTDMADEDKARLKRFIEVLPMDIGETLSSGL